MPKVFILRTKERDRHQQIWRFCFRHPFRISWYRCGKVCSEHLFAILLFLWLLLSLLLLRLNCGRCCSYAAASSLMYKLAGSRNEDMAASHIGPMADVELGPDSEAADDNLLNQSSAFVPRRVALSLLRSRRHVGVFGVAFRRGIHCECCIHQCSYNELMEYCRSTDSPLL